MLRTFPWIAGAIAGLVGSLLYVGAAFVIATKVEYADQRYMIDWTNPIADLIFTPPGRRASLDQVAREMTAATVDAVRHLASVAFLVGIALGAAFGFWGPRNPIVGRPIWDLAHDPIAYAAEARRLRRSINLMVSVLLVLIACMLAFALATSRQPIEPTLLGLATVAMLVIGSIFYLVVWISKRTLDDSEEARLRYLALGRHMKLVRLAVGGALVVAFVGSATWWWWTGLFIATLVDGGLTGFLVGLVGEACGVLVLASLLCAGLRAISRAAMARLRGI